MYQRLVNANFNLNVPRTMLLDDAMPGLAVDPAGAWAFQELQQDLLGFQAKLDTTAPGAVAHGASAPQGQHQRVAIAPRSARKRSVLIDGQKR